MTDTINTTAAPTTPNGKDWEIAIAYLFFPYTIWKRGNDSNALWHSKNAIGILLVTIIAYLIVVALSYVMPISMLSLIGTLAKIVEFGAVAVSLYAAWQAWEGKQWNIPFVTPLGQKIPLEQWIKKATTASAPTTASTAQAVSSSPAAPSEPMNVVTSTASAVSPVAPSEPVSVEAPAPMAAEPMPMAMSEPAPMPEPMPTPVVETSAPVETTMPEPMAPVEPIPMPSPEPTPPATPTQGPTA